MCRESHEGVFSVVGGVTDTCLVGCVCVGVQ